MQASPTDDEDSFFQWDFTVPTSFDFLISPIQQPTSTTTLNSSPLTPPLPVCDQSSSLGLPSNTPLLSKEKQKQQQTLQSVSFNIHCNLNDEDNTDMICEESYTKSPASSCSSGKNMCEICKRENVSFSKGYALTSDNFTKYSAVFPHLVKHLERGKICATCYNKCYSYHKKLKDDIQQQDNSIQSDIGTTSSLTDQTAISPATESQQQQQQEQKQSDKCIVCGKRKQPGTKLVWLNCSLCGSWSHRKCYSQNKRLKKSCFHSWTCLKCKLCDTCGRKGEIMNLCQSCDLSYCITCMTGCFTDEQNWNCMNCFEDLDVSGCNSSCSSSNNNGSTNSRDTNWLASSPRKRKYQPTSLAMPVNKIRRVNPPPTPIYTTDLSPFPTAVDCSITLSSPPLNLTPTARASIPATVVDSATNTTAASSNLLFTSITQPFFMMWPTQTSPLPIADPPPPDPNHTGQQMN